MPSSYYPYFRGKQFDLLALKEVLQAGLLSPAIQPIIEPVKNSKTFFATIAEFQKKHHPYRLIDNPQAGAFLTEKGYATLQDLAQGNSQAHIIDQPVTLADLANYSASTLWIVKSFAALKETPVQALTGSFLVPQEFRLLQQIRESSFDHPLILSEDPFTRLGRNSYYREIPDELFSRRFKDFKKRGFIGFSDFSLDSRIYYEQGYPDRDLALHLVYLAAPQELRVHHFVSPADTEDLGFNQKEKFLQLILQVQSWFSENNDQQTDTLGLKLLYQAAEQGHFPGMGVLRKAVIMHHLECMSRLLETKTEA
ncbi:sce7725 family protein [Enterococcus diestrammenae]|uniref:sce7725 family protein n=1 Tax=Enterococcus diestrammenae TaxID=1155073 RepID=UPI0022E2CFB4|nr:sce7725 family protein [Enterococcus diestrammenae]